MDAILHILLIASFVYFFVVRVTYHGRATRAQTKVERRESILNMIVRGIMGIGYMLAMLVYLIYPGWFEFSALPFPALVRWLGAALTAAGVAGLHWVQWALDVQFNTTLHIQDDHQLIQHGPYRWVRHPMYTVLFGLGLGWGLLSANWLIGFPVSLALIGIVIARVPREEAVLLETFGDRYRVYMEHTGRFLPKLPLARS